jgi:sortase A
MKIIESDNLGGSAPSEGGVTAYCPHCSTPVGHDVEPPWPPNPFVCPTCERHIGRNRASTEPLDGDGAAAPAAREANGSGKSKRGKTKTFLLGRPDGGGAPTAPARPGADQDEDWDPAEDQTDGAEVTTDPNGDSSEFRAVAVQVAASRLAVPPRARIRAKRKVKAAADAIPRPMTRRQRAAKASRDAAVAVKRRLLALRVTGIALLIFGILVTAWGLTTLLWKDPFTSLQTARAQKVVGAEFDALAKDFKRKAAVETRRERRRIIAEEAARMNLNTPAGEGVGKLIIPKIDSDLTIVQSTVESSLARGPSHYTETPLPGAVGKWTIGIAGHRTTYGAPFRHLDKLKPKNAVRIQMPYGLFKYEVYRTRIVDDSDGTALTADAFVTGDNAFNQVALTACHPPGSAEQRIIVYAKLNKVVPARNLKPS